MKSCFFPLEACNLLRRAKSCSLNISRCEGSVFVDLNSYHLKLHRMPYNGFCFRFGVHKHAKGCQRYIYPYKRKPAGEISVSVYPRFSAHACAMMVSSFGCVYEKVGGDDHEMPIIARGCRFLSLAFLGRGLTVHREVR